MNELNMKKTASSGMSFPLWSAFAADFDKKRTNFRKRYHETAFHPLHVLDDL